MPKRDREAVSQGLGQILGGSDAADLLGNVIRSDRQKAGRAEASSKASVTEEAVEDGAGKSQDAMTSHDVSGQYDNKPVGQAGITASLQADNKASSPTDKQASVQTDTSERPIAVGHADRDVDRPVATTVKREGRRKPERGTAELLEGRLAEARRMAESSTTTVTLRLPRELNDWLDEYVHRAWPERVRKQELVIEGLRLLIARRGRPGEPILETNLLPE